MPTIMPPINWLAVLVGGLAIWILGALWYSKAMFVKPWMALQGIPADHQPTEEQKKQMPMMLVQAFICGAITTLVLAVLLNHFVNPTALRGALLGALCAVGFGGVTSYATHLFSMRSRKLWLIDFGHNLVGAMIAGAIIAVWR
ncbi:MAG TPA: DUF1761 domain-containing protein [Gemmatimonadales bacterium]